MWMFAGETASQRGEIYPFAQECRRKAGSRQPTIEYRTARATERQLPFHREPSRRLPDEHDAIANATARTGDGVRPCDETGLLTARAVGDLRL